MLSIINIDGTEYDLKNIVDRSMVYQILSEKMEGCNDDYVEVKGDFKLVKQ